MLWTGSTYFVEVEDLEGVAHRQLQLQQVLVTLINLFQELSILNLQLLEIDLVKSLSQLLLLQTKHRSVMVTNLVEVQPCRPQGKREQVVPWTTRLPY